MDKVVYINNAGGLEDRGIVDGKITTHTGIPGAHHAKAVDNELYGKLLTGLAAARPAAGTANRWYFSTDTKVLEYDTGAAWVEAARGETATRLAQLSEKAHGSLTGVTAAQHHTKYLNAEAIAAVEGNPETLAILLKGANVLHIPTNAGWIETVTGSGTTEQIPARGTIQTLATTGSTAALYAYLDNLRADQAAYYSYADWDKKLYFLFGVCRHNSDANCVSYVRVSQGSTHADMATKGIGIKIENLAVKGVSYGSVGRGEVDLSHNLTDICTSQILIIHYPAEKVEWYIDGVLKGTQSTTTRIPSGDATGVNILHQSIGNGGGTVDARQYLIFPIIWQER